MQSNVNHCESPLGEITVVKLTNRSGASVELSSLGAGIISLCVPDRNGIIENVCLGYKDPADYLDDGPCMGKIPGRYANRIAKGQFSIDGEDYQLAVNNGPNALHGGPTGFQNRLWQTEVLNDGVKFTYESADGEEGYPGNLKVIAHYCWSEDNVLTLRMEAGCDKPTIVNLTNHAYWNLDGADSGSVLEHKLMLRACRYLPTDSTLIPTGELASVASTPMDFRISRALGEFIRSDFPALEFGKGYDACWVLDKAVMGQYLPSAAVLESVRSGRMLTVGTDQPGVQVYTGNWLDGSPKNRAGRPYKDYEGCAIEMQGFPDAPNREGFPCQVLRPGERYSRVIVFDFGIC